MATNKTIRDWLRAQGGHVNDRGRISAEDKQRYYAANPEGGVRLLPGPDDDVDAWEDLGVIGLDGPESDPEPFEDAGGGPVPPEPRESVSVDPEPAHARREWRRPKGGSGPKAAPKRVTAGVRGDIDAKIRFALMVPGSIWKARDPACGGTFVDQTPEIAEAFTDIVCDSADLIAFFSGPGGNFMKALKVGAAVWPVVTMMMAHHVYHTLEEVPVDAQQPDYGSYAA